MLLLGRIDYCKGEGCESMERSLLSIDIVSSDLLHSSMPRIAMSDKLIDDSPLPSQLEKTVIALLPR